MSERVVKSVCEDRGIVCCSCQENVNVHGCFFCEEQFRDDDVVYCIHHSQTDCEHVCAHCWRERTKGGSL